MTETKEANFQTTDSSDTFSREDWTLFRTLNTLTQKAGVATHLLGTVVAKELVDNALDAVEGMPGGAVEVDLLDGNRFYVADNGLGLPVEQLADLFSIRRPLSSSKLLRRPTRGALGNGLRVVTGAVLASGGELTVSTRGQIVRLEPQDDGSTVITPIGTTNRPGMYVEVKLGDALTSHYSPLHHAHRAITFNQGDTYKGKTSPHWYDTDSFYELAQAAGGRSVRDLIAEFEGCTGAKAGQIADGFQGRLAASISREEAGMLLERARVYSRPVKPSRLGSVGDVFGDTAGYGNASTTLTMRGGRGGLSAELPFFVEAWCSDAGTFEVLINKTPITAPVRQNFDKNTMSLFGSGLWAEFSVGRLRPGIFVNIMAAYMPITSDGKAPNLSVVAPAIKEAVKKAIGRSRRALAVVQPGGRVTQKSVIFDNLDNAVQQVSSDGRYRFSQRQLFYALRPTLIDTFDKEPNYDTFAQVLTEYESVYGDIPGMYRDPRGTLYHPHTGEQIPLGTLEVERYSRPAWTFNKILYSEKEGFFSILRAEGWPERHDCALLTSKGQASRAAKDLIDLLGDTDEELTFFCIHDADAAGTMIYQSLQEATKARAARRVNVVNLGLEPEEAEAMGLPSERTDYKKPQPVADYVRSPWKQELQWKRVELNAMTTAQFIAWLDGKMAGYNGKVNPPKNVTKAELAERVEAQIGDVVRERILKAANADQQVRQALIVLQPVIEATANTLPARIAHDFTSRPTASWRAIVEDVAGELVTNAD